MDEILAQFYLKFYRDYGYFKEFLQLLNDA